MRVLIIVLVLLLALLQFKLWFGDGGYRDIASLEERVATQEAENEMLLNRNRELRAEVDDLRERLDAIEERARSELGLIRDGETFYQVVPEGSAAPRRVDEEGGA
ncbi:cell division protein FtsB [Marinihelvus fidelis]|uniref:Cell division protein FtsB n=1 Tax=Marinihelvus fidelis TaxID=2613842 RepID=A0A5N0T7S6_9GAMM|nr:cell division protein FtsB [Marinihelvus fidelis]KAA9129876.1 cell division protein FtsB [Marinihelvus fidelis]